MLLRELPKSLEVSGKVYKIHTDFRLWLGLAGAVSGKGADGAREGAHRVQARVWKEDPRGYERGAGCTSVVLRGRLDAPATNRQKSGFWTGSRTRRRSGQTLSSITEKTCAGRGCTGGTSWHFLPPFRKGASSRGRMSLRAVKLGEIKDPEMRAEYARRKARVRLDGDAPDMDEFYAHIAT